MNVFFFYKNCQYNASMVFVAFCGDIEVRGEYCSSHRGILSLEVGISADRLHGLFFFFGLYKMTLRIFLQLIFVLILFGVKELENTKFY